MARDITPIFTIDHDGAAIAWSPLASGGRAKVLAETWQAWCADGWSQRWTLNSSGDPLHPEWAYVRFPRTRANGSLLSVARVLMNAGKGDIVRYRDGDRTNLRIDNLYLTRGAAKRRDADTPRTPPRKPSAQALRATLSRARACMAVAAGRMEEGRQGRAKPPSKE